MKKKLSCLFSAVAFFALLSGCSAIGGGGEINLLPGSQIDQDLATCLQEKGWASEVGSSGGVTTEFSEEQLDQYEAASKECVESNGLGNDIEVEVTDEMLTDAYALQTETLACLRDEGFDGLSDAPTLQVYLDSGGTWTPYAELPLEMTEAEWLEIQRLCPQPSISAEDYKTP